MATITENDVERITSAVFIEASPRSRSSPRFWGLLVLAAIIATAGLVADSTATVIGEVPTGAQLEAMLNVHGKGRCAITLDPKDKKPGQQPYQGVVALHGDLLEPLQQLSQVLEHYMLQSEQLDTRLILAAND